MTEKLHAKIIEKIPQRAPIIDKPDGDAVKMAPMIVVAPQRTLSAEQAVSAAGEAAEIKRKYPGASVLIGNLPDYGALMLREEKRLVVLKEMTSFADVLGSTGNIAASKELRTRVEEMFIRNSNALERAMERSANRGRH